MLYGILMLAVIVAGGLGVLYYGGRALLGVAELAVIRHERWECEQWADYAKVFRAWDQKTQTGYYLTKWQYDQCEAVGVPIENVHVVK